MGAFLFYYTGTGNSLWAARRIAGELGDTAIVSIPDFKGDPGIVNGRTVGIVFPVHMWGVPGRVLQFVASLKKTSPEYLFAVAVNGGQVANTLVQLRKECARLGLSLGSGIELTMPSNYIPWGGPGPMEEQVSRFVSAKTKIFEYIHVIQEKQTRSVQKGPTWQRILFSMVYRMSFPYVNKMDRKFLADDKCTRCGTCEKVCPSGNIIMSEGKPVWKHRCEQCFACLQWCPARAIQYGNKTHLYERYHQPEVKLTDMVAPNGERS